MRLEKLLGILTKATDAISIVPLTFVHIYHEFANNENLYMRIAIIRLIDL